MNQGVLKNNKKNNFSNNFDFKFGSIALKICVSINDRLNYQVKGVIISTEKDYVLAEIFQKLSPLYSNFSYNI